MTSWFTKVNSIDGDAILQCQRSVTAGKAGLVLGSYIRLQCQKIGHGWQGWLAVRVSLQLIFNQQQ